MESTESEEVKKFSETEQEEKVQPSDAFKHLQKQSLERSQFSKTYKNLKLIFSDEMFRYDLTFTIDLEKAASQDGQPVDPETIEECQVEIKRYSLDEDSKVMGQIQKDIKIEEINEKMFEELLTELEEKYPTDEEVDDWEIETE
jgi:rubrerythrin